MRLLNVLRGKKRRLDQISKWHIKPHSRDVEKAFVLLDAIRNVANVDGCFVECGVGSGGSLSTLVWMLKKIGTKRKIYAFDSFEGFPEGSQEDSIDFSPKSKTIYEQFDIDFVTRNIERRLGETLSPSEVQFVKGYFPQSFSQFNDASVALLHIDVDLYQSYVDVLNFFVPKMTSGGIILFDEYDKGNDLEKWPGAKRAIDAFIKDSGFSLQKHFTGFTQVTIK